MAEPAEQRKIDRVLRKKLRELCVSARSDAKLFAVLTVLITPVAVAVFAFILMLTLGSSRLSRVNHFGYRLSFVSVVNLCLAFMVVSYFLRPKEPYQRRENDANWLLLAGGLFCGILGLSYAIPLAQTNPEWFWPLHVLLTLGMLGCVGHAYEPKDEYYLGWTAGPVLMDNPFTIQDDVDRTHIGLGFVVSIAGMIFDSYGAVLGSRWLWNGLQESELSVSIKLLQALAARDASEVTERVRELTKDATVNSVRALVELELVFINKGNILISMKGRKFLDINDWP